MDDFQTLRVEAAVAVFVAWPTSAMSYVVTLSTFIMHTSIALTSAVLALHQIRHRGVYIVGWLQMQHSTSTFRLFHV